MQKRTPRITAYATRVSLWSASLNSTNILDVSSLLFPGYPEYSVVPLMMELLHPRKKVSLDPSLTVTTQQCFPPDPRQHLLVQLLQQ